MVSLRKLMVRTLQATGLNRTAHRLYYRHVHGFEPATAAVADAMQRVLAMADADGLLDQGDYCEFGIFKGATLWSVQRQLAQKHPRSRMRCFGFDSFEGLPELRHDADRTDHDEFYAGQYACGYDQVRAQMEQAGTDWSRTFLVKGFFDQSLTEEMAASHGLDRVAIALVDCDLYASTVDVLRFLAPRLVDNAIVLMDDWGCFRNDPNRGQQRALRECVDALPEVHVTSLFSYGAWGQVFRWHTTANAASAENDERDSVYAVES